MSVEVIVHVYTRMMTSTMELRAEAGDSLEFLTQISSLSIWIFLEQGKTRRIWEWKGDFTRQCEPHRQKHNTKLSSRSCFLHSHQGLRMCPVCLFLCGLGCGTRLGRALHAISVDHSSLTLPALLVNRARQLRPFLFLSFGLFGSF